MARPSLNTQVALIDQRITAVEGEVKGITEKLDRVLEQHQKYKGFWGAITLVGSALWAAFTYFFNK